MLGWWLTLGHPACTAWLVVLTTPQVVRARCPAAVGQGKRQLPPDHLLCEQLSLILEQVPQGLGNALVSEVTPFGVTHRSVWRCFCLKPSGTVGSGFTPQLTDVIQKMLCDFIVFICKFFPVFCLKELHLDLVGFLTPAPLGSELGVPAPYSTAGAGLAWPASF